MALAAKQRIILEALQTGRQLLCVDATESWAYWIIMNAPPTLKVKTFTNKIVQHMIELKLIEATQWVEGPDARRVIPQVCKIAEAGKIALNKKTKFRVKSK